MDAVFSMEVAGSYSAKIFFDYSKKKYKMYVKDIFFTLILTLIK